MVTDSLSTKLVVDGADSAISFYLQCLDAEVLQRFNAGNSVVFAQLAVAGGTISLKDADSFDPAPGPDSPGTIIEVTTDDPDAFATRMLNAGASVIVDVADQSYGARAGRLRDPFGHQWLLTTPSVLTPEQIQASFDA